MENIQKVIDFVEQKERITSGEISRLLGVSRQYASIILSDLVDKKKIYKLGSTRNAQYVSYSYVKNNPDIIPISFKKRFTNKGLEEHKVLTEIEEKFTRLSELSENVRSIFAFAFSEMLNNAIEHSNSQYIALEITLRDNTLIFSIEDSGVGVFRNIQKKRKLANELEAVQDLLKGKTTTMPKSHSGEGIFFTSKAGNVFILESFGLQLLIEPIKNNIQIKNILKKKRGTRVTFQIDIHSNVHLTDIFRKYTNLTESSDYGFDKTEIRVKLFTSSGVHISRSQARRILSGLDAFQIILLDFENVPIIGQAFADEIYRVFKNSHPHIVIQEENMSEGVRFMVERAKNEAKKKIL
jgi:hypothetical protein